MQSAAVVSLIVADEDKVVLRRVQSLRVIRDTTGDPALRLKASAECLRLQNMLYKKRCDQLLQQTAR